MGCCPPKAELQGPESMPGSEPLPRAQVPLLLERRPKELLSNLRGFFPAAIEPYKVRHTLSRGNSLQGSPFMCTPSSPHCKPLCPYLT